MEYSSRKIISPLLFATVSFALATFSAPRALAQDEGEPIPAYDEGQVATEETTTLEAEDTSWHKERDDILKKIKTEIKTQVNNTVTKQTVAKQLRYKFPVPTPTMSVADIQKEARVDAIRAVESKYPYSLLKDLPKDAEKRYPLFKVGDQISLVRRGGIGMSAKVSGKLKGVADERIRVGNIWILRDDLDPEQQANFYPDLNETRRAKFMHRKNIELKRTRHTYFLQCFNQESSKRFKNHHYAIYQKKWLPKTKIVDIEVAKRKKQLGSSLAKKVETNMFQQHNYIQYENEWVPAQIAEERKLKAMLAQQSAAAPEGAEEEEMASEELGEPVENQEAPAEENPLFDESQ